MSSYITPLLCDTVNHSLAIGFMPSSLKSAVVAPVLISSTLNQNKLKHCRLVSNLTHTSKLIKRVVSKHIVKNCELNNINNYQQSAYKVNHSTETALMKVQKDTIQPVDSQGDALLVLFDLFAFEDICFNLTIEDFVLVQLQELRVEFKWFFRSSRYISVGPWSSIYWVSISGLFLFFLDTRVSDDY